MTEILLSVASKVAEYLVEPTIRHGQYLFCVSKITNTLEDKKKELTLTRDNVLDRVKEAKEKTERIENEVEKWLDEVTNVLEEVENLQQQMKANSTCFQRWCPNWRRRYCLCKQMVKKTEIITQLSNNSKFERFSRLASLPTIEYFSHGKFTYFESTRLAYNKLLEAIQDDSTYIIGLWGMGGCGKTTLVKEVGRRAKELSLFDHVIFVTVSQNPNIRNIQGEIADTLKLTLVEESIIGRAQRLWMRMKDEKRVLVILDDVWARIKLEDIGIPQESDSKGCKVLLTTRRQQVCTLMECQRNVPLHLLSDEEAWTLFQKNAGLDGGSSSIILNELAEGIVKECKGLPLAIEAVGRSLRGKSADEWKIAFDRLKHSKPVDIEEGEEDVYRCLQLSYDYLRDELARSLFKMCGIFPEDHEVPKEDLFRYGVGMNLCGEIESLDIARSQVNASINNLISSSLLKNSDEKEGHVRMHDLVRDVALWIASREDHAIMVNPEKANLREKLKDYFAVSSWNNEIDQVTDEIDVPNLEILLLHARRSLELSDASFDGMKRLKVMAIICSDYFPMSTSLPKSTQLLTTLRILRLVRWKLGDISCVVCLRGLEILDLQESRFWELPKGIEKLNKLKLLDLSMCEIQLDCYQVIRKCSQLEELYAHSGAVGGYFGSIDPFGCSVEDACFPKLQRYELQIGKFGLAPSSGIYADLRGERVVYMGKGYLSTYTIGTITKDLLRRAVGVAMRNLIEGCKNIPEMVQAIGGMNELSTLQLKSCPEIEYLIDTTSHQAHLLAADADVVLPKLVRLWLYKVVNLKQVCRGPPPLTFFDKLQDVQISYSSLLVSVFPRECSLCSLKIVYIESCPELAFLFSMSVARTLAQLEELQIKTCDKLEQIVTSEGEEMSPALEGSRLMFPKLKTLRISNCSRFECALPMCCAEGLQQLERIEISRCDRMKYVFGEDEQHVPSSNEIEFPVVKQIGLWDLDDLLSICPEKYQTKWPSLRDLRVSGCSKFNTSCINAIQN